MRVDVHILGKRINALQCWLGIDNFSLAEMIGYSEQTLADWKYRRYPSSQGVEKLAEAFGISIQELTSPEGCDLVTKAMKYTVRGRWIVFSPRKVCGLIEDAHMTHDAAAKAFGTDYFFKAKSGSHYTYHKNLSKVAETFGVSMEELC